MGTPTDGSVWAGRRRRDRARLWRVAGMWGIGDIEIIESRSSRCRP